MIVNIARSTNARDEIGIQNWTTTRSDGAVGAARTASEGLALGRRATEASVRDERQGDEAGERDGRTDERRGGVRADVEGAAQGWVGCGVAAAAGGGGGEGVGGGGGGVRESQGVGAAGVDGRDFGLRKTLEAFIGGVDVTSVDERTTIGCVARILVLSIIEHSSSHRFTSLLFALTNACKSANVCGHVSKPMANDSACAMQTAAFESSSLHSQGIMPLHESSSVIA